MPSSLNGTGITFNDATTQSTAATAAALVTTNNVLSATAGASAGAVGTYAFLLQVSHTTRNAGDTLAGSSLRYASGASYWNGTVNRASGTPAGTWRLMGYIVAYSTGCEVNSEPSVWLRIS